MTENSQDKDTPENCCSVFTQAFDTMDDIVCVADPKTHELLLVNAAFRKFFGDPGDRPCYTVFQGRDTPCALCSDPVPAGQEPGHAHVWEYEAPGTGQWFQCRSKVIDWMGNRTVRLGTATDITALKSREKRLTTDIKRFETLVDSTDDFISTAGLDGTIVYTNPQGMAMTGWAGIDPGSMSIRDFHSKRWADMIETELIPKVKQQGLWRGEMELKHRSGFPIAVEGSIFLIRDIHGNPMGVGAIYRDIREWKAIEQVLGSDAVSSRDAMGSFIQEIRRFARLDRGSIHHAVVDIEALARGVIMEVELSMNQGEIKLETGTLPMAWADPDMVWEMLSIIFSGILDPGSREGNRIRFHGLERSGYTEYVVTTLGKDECPSMPEQDNFSSQALEFLEPTDETGIRSAMVRRIIHRHGGVVWTQGHPGQDMTLAFTLPAWES
ncbi:MAG: PAS domain S-box protein [Pseudomonadota bacterium]